MATKIFTYDTTLRDGTQGEEVAFSADDKVKIAKRLDAFGIDSSKGDGPVRTRKIWNSSNGEEHSILTRETCRIRQHAPREESRGRRCEH